MNKVDFLNLCKNGDLVGIQEAFNDGFDLSEEFADDEHDQKPLCHAKNGDTAQLLIDNDPDESLFEPGPDTPVIHYVIDSVARGCIDISSLRISSKYDQTLNQDYGDEGYAIHVG